MTIFSFSFHFCLHNEGPHSTAPLSSQLFINFILMLLTVPYTGRGEGKLESCVSVF